MPDAIDAVDPNNIGPQWDRLPVIRATVLADPAAQLFDSESGNAGVDAVARAMLVRLGQGKWSVGYTNESNQPQLTRALAALELRWLGVEQWPVPGPYLHAAAPGVPPGTVPVWCPVAPVAVQDRWVNGEYDLSTVFGAYPARVLGYVDGQRSAWPAAAWDRFKLIPDVGPPPPPPPTPLPPIGATDMSCVFTTAFDRNQQHFYVDGQGALIHHWWDHAANQWSGPQTVGTGWKSVNQQVAQDSAGTYQVWGELVDGQQAQCYWSGTAWVTQAL